MPVSTGAKSAIGIAGALVAALAWIVWSQAGSATPGTAADLIDSLEKAERRPAAAVFDVGPVTINGESIRAIATPAASRITWELRLPDRARLEIALALKPEAWTVAGDGVLFRVGIAEGRTHEDVVTRVVNPYSRAEDRRWIPISVDLGAHSGFKWSLFYHPRLILWRIVLNTSAANPAGTEHGGDLPLWGEPRLASDSELELRPRPEGFARPKDR
jgi:hypothetical protein